MSEFGNETTTAAFRASEKVTEALFRFLKFLIERKENKINAKLKKEQLSEMKLHSKEVGAKLKIQGKTGYVKAKLLQDTNLPMAAVTSTYNKDQMKRFASIAKKYNLLYTSISDQTIDGQKKHTLFVLERDLMKAKQITDRIIMEVQLQGIDDKISKLSEKEHITPEDLKELESLKRQKATILHEETKDFNDKNEDIIFEDICEDKKASALSFSEALNHFTDRNYAQKEPYFLCERTNPNSYIELTSARDTFNGEEYTKTNYRVFKDGKEQDGDYSDARFEGRPKGYWNNLRETMKSVGDFSDDVVVFNSKAEFDKYRQIYQKAKEQQGLDEQEKISREKTVDTHVPANDPHNVAQLKKQLNERGADFKDGAAVDIKTGKPLSLDMAQPGEDRVRVSESILIAKQIVNCEKIQEIQGEIKAKTEQLENPNQRSYFAIVDKETAKEYITDKNFLRDHKNFLLYYSEKDHTINPTYHIVGDLIYPKLDSKNIDEQIAGVKSLFDKMGVNYKLVNVGDFLRLPTQGFYQTYKESEIEFTKADIGLCKDRLQTQLNLQGKLDEERGMMDVASEAVKNTIGVAEYKNYSKIIDKLKAQLESRGIEVKDGSVIDKETGRCLTIESAKTDEEKVAIAENVVMAKQLANYTAITECQNQMAIDSQGIAMQGNTEIKEVTGINDHEEIQTLLSKLQAEIDRCNQEIISREAVSKELIDAREQIVGISASNQVDKDFEAEREPGRDQTDSMNQEETTHTMDEWKSRVTESRENLQQPSQDKAIDRSADKGTPDHERS